MIILTEFAARLLEQNHIYIWFCFTLFQVYPHFDRAKSAIFRLLLIIDSLDLHIMYRRLRDLREDFDMTQAQVAKVLNMSQTGYSKYETGENDIPTSVLIRLSAYYDVSVDYLLGLTNAKDRYLDKNV